MRATRTASAREITYKAFAGLLGQAWAKHHGIAVSARGRSPASVTEQYQAATGN